MSFTSVDPATSRLHRSELAVPGSNAALFEKASKSPADIVFLDLEDAVAPDDKAQARKNIIQALNEIDWGSKTMMVRINGLDTHYMYRDVIDVVEACPRLDMILIPKVGVRGGRVCRRYARHPDRDGHAPHQAHRIRSADRDGARHGERRDHRAIEQAPRGHVLRCRGLCGLHAGAHDRDRRGEQATPAFSRTRTRRAGGNITGPIPGMRRRPGC